MGKGKSMIGTITLNPCIDKTLTINGFTFGGMNRVQEKRSDISGKGVNVSIVLSQIGYKVKTVGISYECSIEILREGLRDIGVEYEGTIVPGVMRENMKIYDVESNLTTEFNQKGDYVSRQQLEVFTRYLWGVLDELDILVVTGSVPQGVPNNYYYRLIRMAKEKNVTCILDAEGGIMLEGIAAGPYLIKPNLYEFKTAFGLKTNNMKEILFICRSIIKQGVKMVCLSMGCEGAIIVDSKEAYICNPTPTNVKSTQGAGDSLVAGICIAIEEKLDMKEMLRCGVAAAQGSLIREGTQLCRKEEFLDFKDLIKVHRIIE